MQSLVFGLEVIVTYDIPEVLLPEIGHGVVDPPNIKTVDDHDEWANGFHVMLDTEELLTVRWDQVRARGRETYRPLGPQKRKIKSGLMDGEFGLTVSTATKKINHMKLFNWKRLGLGIAAVWIIVLVAAFGATIYREIDGPSVRSTMAENVELTKEIVKLTSVLEKSIDDHSLTAYNRDSINAKLIETEQRISEATKQLDRFKASWPIIWLSVGVR